MSNQIQTYQPASHTTSEGKEISFYVSADGTKTGVSRNGLSELVGLSRSMFSDTRWFLGKLFGGLEYVENDVPNYLKPLIDGGLPPVAPGSKTNYGDSIITSEYAIAIIEYYALEKDNRTAKNSYKAFAKMGFDSWVKQVTNYQDTGHTDKALNTILALVQETRKELAEIRRESSTVVSVYVHSTLVNSTVSANQFGCTPFTVAEWLVHNELDRDDRTYRRMCLRVAESYKSLTGTMPKFRREQYRSADGKLIKKKVNIYRAEHNGLLRAAYYKLNK